jgi:hypothetical protein
VYAAGVVYATGAECSTVEEVYAVGISSVEVEVEVVKGL